MDPGLTMPSWRSGNTHGFCVTGGHSPIASEPTPSPRLWATAPGATPARLCEHTMRGHKPTFKTGTFYLAGSRNFLFGSDIGIKQRRSARPASMSSPKHSWNSPETQSDTALTSRALTHALPSLRRAWSLPSEIGFMTASSNSRSVRSGNSTVNSLSVLPYTGWAFTI